MFDEYECHCKIQNLSKEIENLLWCGGCKEDAWEDEDPCYFHSTIPQYRKVINGKAKSTKYSK